MALSPEFLLLVDAVNRRNWTAAKRHGERCLASGTTDPRAFGYLALANASLGEQNEALRLAQTVRREAPNDAANLCLVAEVLLLCERLDEAEETLLTAKRNAPNNARCLGLLCNVALRRQSPKQLSQRIDALSRVHPRPIDILRLEGLLAMMLEQPDIAETCFRGVLREEPEDPTAHFKLAEIYFFRADARTAHRHAEAAAQADPESLPARNLAKALDKSGSWIHRAWFRMAVWFALPKFRVATMAAAGVLLFIALRVPPLAGLIGALYLIASLSGYWYLAGIIKVIKAKENRVELSPDY